MGEDVKPQFGKVRPHVALVFLSGERRPEDGEPYQLAIVETFSSFPTARIVKHLGTWRNRPFAEDEPLPHLSSLVGKWALAGISHSTGATKYANIISLSPVPKGLPLPAITVADYTPLTEYWEKRKERMAERVRAFRATQPQPTPQGKPRSATMDDAKAALDLMEAEDDGLPW
jgi:hypothetical protein